MIPLRRTSFLAVLLFSAISVQVITPITAFAQQEKEGTWTCPMHLQVTSDKPGSCPICGMALVEREPRKSDYKKASVPKGHASFELSLERQQMIGVKTSRVQKGPLFKKIRAAGRLAFDPDLYTAQSEYIEALRYARKMQDSPLAEARQSAQRMIESSKFRLKVLGLSDEQINKLGQTAKSDTTLLVTKVGADAWIYADIYETDLTNVRAGLAAEISGSFLQGQTLKGQVASIDRVIDPNTRTAKARIRVQKTSIDLRPQSYVDVDILVPLGDQVWVPFDAVFDTGAESWVFLVDGEGHFEPRLITIRSHAGDRVAIASGLKGGERIVTSANFLIDSESRLKAGSEEDKSDSIRKKPSCPENEYWDTGMSMCMPKVSK